jgi:hypothetical protein
VALSTSLNPTQCYPWGFGNSGPLEYRASLLPSTTYYWRVGFVYDGDITNIIYWSEQ